ncbi:Tryptophanyl-tRNA synthetase TrpS [Helicobacter sp. NHP19-012]|uniref:Tryptophan--tRNA ligase n=1 Tax=Helicobacter gastrofelis TaxID=2849642 RepID=A0ABM7SDU0_9HELI|nr:MULTISPECIES: tryptophan--tRNA ligase [unclassified Helicobacter]BCZ18942.1 Tryptophanyl-tRNA synthetase TrpS [Helicobacter sp. NHP19-012]GMB96339.1 Tryptophanyl-tRNA synthetase TrpS [Helicobacter sp. NHP22-001]
MSKARVFSGIQPTGGVHLGNYLGAIKQWVKAQDIYENIFCIVNSHAITIPKDPKELHAQSLEMATLLLACGIEPSKSSLFIQSQIDEHGALAWLLNCIAGMGELNRMTQFKDKSAKQEQVSAGLFAYPVLMAADILLYQTNAVPVGEDQKQHLELARNLAQRFNRDYGACFVVPEPLIAASGARVMGLDDPSIKMSKSHKAPLHALFLLDTPDLIAKKIKKATTDSMGVVAFDATRAGLYNLLGIYENLSGQSRAQIENDFQGKGYGHFKNALIELLISTLTPIQENYKRLQESPDYVLKVLNDGCAKVRPLAQATYGKAKTLMGLV